MLTVRGTMLEDYIRLTPLPEISRQSFDVTASLGGRVVSNNSIALLGVEGFALALHTFERTRSGEAILEGTYEFLLTVTPHGRTGAAWLGFRLVDLFLLENGSHGRHTLEGGFPVAGDRVGSMAADLLELLLPTTLKTGST